MGILGLSKLIADVAPSAIKENEMKNFFGRKVAVDASMCLYQFLVAVRQEGANLTDADGETTSHLMGMFYRTIRMVDNGIKPVYVFDGKPPEMKGGELAKRAERREVAEKALTKAQEKGNQEDIDKFSRRLVKVTKAHADECKQLLKLMGIPYVEISPTAEEQLASVLDIKPIEIVAKLALPKVFSLPAPCEAEAQCAALVKAGRVYATATEDMDALTFGSTVLLRHMTFSEARKMPIREFHLNHVLEEAGLSQEEFIDLCILMGCDYCDSIRGIGPKRAIELIQKHRSIDAILEKLDKGKYQVPENWPYAEARRLFITPEVTDATQVELKWTEPDEDGLVAFMCTGKGFNEDRIRNGAKKLSKARNTTTQGRLDSFFKVLPSPNAGKRKADDKKAAANKKAKPGGGKYRRGK